MPDLRSPAPEPAGPLRASLKRLLWKSRMAEPAPHPAPVGRTARPLPDEMAVAITCNGTAHGVMMGTPADLTDFAWGFALTEGLLEGPEDVERFELVHHEGQGVEARFWLGPARAALLGARRRRRAGPVGCGLCGVESLAEAARPALSVRHADLTMTHGEIAGATDAIRRFQPLRGRSGGLHAAGFLRPGLGLALVREDVGRHNALDKVCGALLRDRLDAEGGALVVSSRVSVDLVQKCAAAGCPVLIGAATPTGLAVEAAETAGLTLVARAREGAFEIFSHPHRVV